MRSRSWAFFVPEEDDEDPRSPTVPFRFLGREDIFSPTAPVTLRNPEYASKCSDVQTRLAVPLYWKGRDSVQTWQVAS